MAGTSKLDGEKEGERNGLEGCFGCFFDLAAKHTCFLQ